MSASAPNLVLAGDPLPKLDLRKIAVWRRLRVLAWQADTLYASRGYELLALNTGQWREDDAPWKRIAAFQPKWWRGITSQWNLASRLVRDGFHALAVLSEQTMIAAVPGAIVTRESKANEFVVTHAIRRGTRPLHITSVPGGNIYWGEYFDNRDREEVHVYASTDQGKSWQVAYTFPRGTIRHVHNIVYDRWGECLWILTGDEGAECRILRASCDFRSIETVVSGNQQARAVAAVPTPDGLFLSTDTPLEQNHILRLDRHGNDRRENVRQIARLENSSIFGCRSRDALLFSTMAEPSDVNSSTEVQLVGSADGIHWQTLVRWQKDSWPMKYFQYGNIILPDGENTTSFLAATTVAVKHDDCATTVWKVVLDPAVTLQGLQPVKPS